MIARQQRDKLAEIARGAIISATKAAEAGRLVAVPERVDPAGTATLVVALDMTATRSARCAEALAGAGSNMRSVVIRAFESYVAAGGSWPDAPMPGDVGSRWRRPARRPPGG